MSQISDLYHTVTDLASNPRHTKWLHPLLLLADTGLTVLVVKKIPYTEIDFSTYMQQVQFFIYGVRDYNYLEGSTGPLVYPAMHVYIYSFLWWVCKRGEEILRGQVIFGLLYIFTLDRVITAYRRAGAPPYLLPLLVLSKRLHSIFVLRLFNDCFAALFLWLSVLAYQNKRWVLGSIVFSLGVGIKMTLLLALPGIVILLGTALPIWHAVEALGAMWGVQVLIAGPFIQKNAESYMARAFEFGRQFLFKWTVNWRFVGEETFKSPGFSESLLTIHAVLLGIFVLTRWLRPSGLSVYGHVKRALKPLPVSVQANMSGRLGPNNTATFILTSLAIGMLCARSLHYQFFAYLAWASPFLWWKAGLHPVVIYVLWAAQEWAWNVYPSTDTSSRVVVISLAIQVFGVWWGTRNEVSELQSSSNGRRVGQWYKDKVEESIVIRRLKSFGRRSKQS